MGTFNSDYEQNPDRVETQVAVDDMITQLKAFKQATFNLEDAWSNVYLPSEVDDLASELYPFNSSFDELGWDISEWVDHAIAQLKDLRRSL